MNEQTKNEMMAFMEGEMPPLQANRFATRLQNERTLRNAWESHYQISFLLQNERPGARWASSCFADRVATLIEAEPCILAPRNTTSRRLLSPFWMKAGSVAAVLVVSITLVGLLPHNTLTNGQIATAVGGQGSRTALLRGVAQHQDTQPQEVFHLRPVADFNPPPARADMLIQNDIKRLWIPGSSNYLPVSEPINYQSASLHNTVYNATSGISAASFAVPAGYP